MASSGDLLSISEAAQILGVSVRHARRLADSGDLVKVARGLIARDSLDRYLAAQRQGRTRSWAEHTAWGAIALLSGAAADWLGTTQASRVRHVLREIDQSAELLTRLRNRARVHTFSAHRAALPRLRTHVAASDLRQLGIVSAGAEHIDGYVATDRLDGLVSRLGLRADVNGSVVLRATAFDFDRVAALVHSVVVAALDAATSTDPRVSGVGDRALTRILEEYQ